ncbi:MAG: hypothetical protein ACMUIU_16945 [bacterium]
MIKSLGSGFLYPIMGKANFYPRLHGLVSKGEFDEKFIFHSLPWIDKQKMAVLFMDKVFSMFIKKGYGNILTCSSLTLMPSLKMTNCFSMTIQFMITLFLTPLLFRTSH